MTLPYERTRTLVNTYDFLQRLSSPYVENGIKRIPAEIRKEARWLMKHFPRPYDIHAAAKCAPDVFDEQEIMRYEEERNPDLIKPQGI
jgi:hypothetical protein